MRVVLASLTVIVAAGSAAAVSMTPTAVMAQAAVKSAAKAASYKLISEAGADGRHNVSVRIATRINEAEIKRIADELIARRQAATGRVVIQFFLDGMPPDQSPWAVATYQSELKIAISGLKLEEEELYVSELRNDRRQIVGAWMTAPPAVPGRLAIFRDKGKVFAEWRLRNGMKTVDELDESRVSRGRRYDIKGENAGHFVVTAAGVLELRDADKLIAVAERIAPEKLVPSATAGNAPVAQPASPSSQSADGSSVPVSPAATPTTKRTAAGVDDVGQDAVAAPITAAEPKPQPRKRVARPQPSRPVKSAARDNGPIMRLPGQ